MISYQEFITKEKDELIICSDGVHSVIDSQTLLFLMNDNKAPNSFIDTLNHRLKNEAIDNASLISISVNNNV